MRPLLAGANALVGVSHFEAELFAHRLHLPLDRFAVVPNGSHLPKVIDAPPLDPEHPLILSVGRLEKYKGHQRILRAFPQIREQIPGARLRIIGGGPYEPELRKLAAELGLTGEVEIGALPPENRQGMASIVMQASLVVLLSDYEAHPISVMEALAMKRSILVTDTSGLGEIARKGWARSIPPGSDTDTVVAAVVDQLRHPLVAPDIELPTWEQCVDSLMALYTNLARTTRAA
jgi:glycosyltransferase involved in cell wall biosynthesis